MLDRKIVTALVQENLSVYCVNEDWEDWYLMEAYQCCFLNEKECEELIEAYFLGDPIAVVEIESLITKAG
jgi:hypothetical protein